MLYQLMVGGILSLVNFGIHAVMTGIIVVASHHTAAATDEFHEFVRVASLMLLTLSVLMVTHVVEISVWAGYYAFDGIETEKAGTFEFAFENYTALGYGDAVPSQGLRLIGPITALNGLLLIGWSVAIIFEVLRMAEVQIARKPPT
ncbi:MAG: ion channel [Alphaproteobacteria bacterium]|nr:ion channel [Alphaproteobacteria bacterium]